MAYCGKCGMQVENQVKLCPGCERAIDGTESTEKNDFETKFQKLNNTTDTTGEFDAKDIADNKVIAILSYLGILVLVPIFGAKGSKFARFHANQGLVLCITAVVYSIAYSILTGILIAVSWRLYAAFSGIFGFVSLIFAVWVILGIVNAIGGKAKELPVIGKFKILK